MFLIAFGAPGVGKGTQAKILSQVLGIPHISTGEILREAAKKKDPEVMHAFEIISKGYLFPDELAIKIVENTLSKPEGASGAILDGFPRTIYQAQIFEKILEHRVADEVYLLNFIASEEEIVRRLNNRRTCRECHAIYDVAEVEHLKNCPECGAADSFYQRAEDGSSEGIKKRLQIFESRTQPLLAYYSTFRNIIEIDGTQAIEKVTEDILAAIGYTKS
jgi:adenylate kinase